MVFAGIKKKDERANLIAYLQVRSSGPRSTQRSTANAPRRPSALLSSRHRASLLGLASHRRQALDFCGERSQRDQPTARVPARARLRVMTSGRVWAGAVVERDVEHTR